MVSTIPGVEVKLLGAQTEPRMRSHDIICLHTMVGYLYSTDNYFRNVNGAGFSGTESHFGIGGKWGSDFLRGLDGVTWQWQDLDFQADANLDGGHRVISIETADNAPASAVDIAEWTPKQVDEIVRVCYELCKKYNIPAVLIPDTLPGRRGIGYHRQGIDPWRVSGGEYWSKSRGKGCPTDRRIAQLNNTIIPRVRFLLQGGSLPTPEAIGDVMFTVDIPGGNQFVSVPLPKKPCDVYFSFSAPGPRSVNVIAWRPVNDITKQPVEIFNKTFSGWMPDIRGHVVNMLTENEVGCISIRFDGVDGQFGTLLVCEK